MPVRLSWYLWGKYRQKVWLSENQSLSERRAETLGVTSFAFLTFLSSLRWWDLHVILSLVPPPPSILQHVSKARMHNVVKLASVCYSVSV